MSFFFDLTFHESPVSFAGCGGRLLTHWGGVPTELCFSAALLPSELQAACGCVLLLSSSLSDTGLKEGDFSEEGQVTGKFADTRSVHAERATSCRPP